jgi:8-oxo-dGTP pyrophosphatase MutT (NUDIX family)
MTLSVSSGVAIFAGPCVRRKGAAAVGTRRAAPDQAAVVPFRGAGDAVEICLIRRRGTERWGIPKGYIDGDDSPADAALTEAREEAGLIGRVEGAAVGTYEYSKLGDDLTVAVFVMRADEALPVWEEMDLRERRWVTLAVAARLLAQHPVSVLWDRIHRRVAPRG